MAYEDLKNTILNNYGGQDNVPDSVYNALLKYKQNGQDALDDRDYAILTEAKSYSQSPSTYQFAPGQREDLMANLHEVGYSGLDDAQKALYKRQYYASDYAKAGHSFEEAIDLADRSARNYSPEYKNQSQADQELANQRALQYSNEGGNAYTLAQNVLSVPVGAVMSTAEYAKDRLFTEGGWLGGEKPWIEYFKEALELGNKGDGATGFFSEPTQAVGLGLPVSTAKSLLTRFAIEGAKGAGLMGAYDIGTGNTDHLIRDLAIGGVLGGSIGAVTSKPASVQAKQEAEALRTFPGDTYFRTQANKGSEIYEPMSNLEKKEILQSIPAPYDKEAWIRYYEGISQKAKAGYDAADEIARTHKNLPGAEIPMSELKSKMIENMEKGVGQYSKKDAERFVKNKLAGFEDKYGPNGKVPVYELGLIKGKFTEDIFDPRFSVAEGTATKRALSRKAGSTIEDYRANRPAYMTDRKIEDIPSTGSGPSQALNDVEKALANMTEDEIDNFYKNLRQSYTDNAFPYNTLLEKVSPGTRDLYRRGQILEDIFQHQAENIGSQRTGKGLLGKLFEGAKHTYGPSGNAYIDPVILLQKSQSQYPTVLGKLGTLGAYDLGRGLLKGIDSTRH